MRKLIITNGTGGAGKDTFCKYITEYLETKGYKACRYSYADFARYLLSKSGIDTNKKTNKDRILLAGLNKLLEEYDDIPFKDCCQFIDDTLFNCDDTECIPEDVVNVILLDVRVPKVIDKFKNVYSNVITVLIENGVTNTATKEDSGVFDYCYDSIISNTKGYDYLKEQAESFSDKFILKGDECRKMVIKT